jgi:hypothetical protein
MKLSQRLSPATIAAGVFVAALGVFLWLYTRSPLLYDADAYYHLTVARAQAAEGLRHEFPWTRFGILARGYGDKEFLFHLLIAPFVSLAEPELGGRLALAGFDAAVLAAIAWVASHALGAWGALVPFWLWLGSTELAWRMVRLRPELLSLLLLIAALWAVARRRYRLLGLIALLYALSYVAIHAFVGLCLLLFVILGLAERRWEWPLLLYPVLGAGVGLAIHPQFPHNLTVVWFHAVEFFRFKGELDVGTEIRPNFTDVTLMANLGWWLGLLALWRSAEPAQPAGVAPPRDEVRRAATCFGVAALVFGGLYLLMSRFSIYAVPFATLWLLFEIRRRGWRVGGRVRLPGGRAMPLWVAAAICLLLALPIAARELGRYSQRNDPGPENARRVDRERWAQAVPRGARVAAPWGPTALYMFYAPWGRYLNVLDPGLLAYSDPEVHATQWRVFTGIEPDVPLRVVTELESDHLAYALTGSGDRLTDRLERDPRVVPLYQGGHGLFGICGACNSGFVLDWRATRGEGETPVGSGEWTEYPRRTGPAARIEGFVDASRIEGEGDCVTFSRLETLARAERRLYELAPYGPAALSLNGERRVEIGGPLGAMLGRGVALPLDLEAGENRLTVATCAAAPGEPVGFYLLQRPQS